MKSKLIIIEGSINHSKKQGEVKVLNTDGVEETLKQIDFISC